MEATLYKIKEDLTALGAQIAQDANWIAEKAGDPQTKMEDIQAKKKHRDELQERFDMLKEQHDAMEQKGKEAVRRKDAANSPEKERQKAKGKFYRDALQGAKQE